MDWQKTATIGAFVVAIILGVGQFYVWYEHGEIGVNRLVAFAVLVILLFISGLLHLKAPRASFKGEMPSSMEIKPSVFAPTDKAKKELPSAETSGPTILPDNRIVIGLAPEKLCAFFEGVTTAQGNRMVQPYLGKWMKVSGEVTDTNHVPGQFSRISFGRFGRLGECSFTMFFEEKWSEHVSILNAGETVTVLGQLKSVEQTHIVLDPCELVS
jgi:hypothetical protein